MSEDRMKIKILADGTIKTDSVNAPIPSDTDLLNANE